MLASLWPEPRRRIEARLAGDGNPEPRRSQEPGQIVRACSRIAPDSHGWRVCRHAAKSPARAYTSTGPGRAPWLSEFPPIGTERFVEVAAAELGGGGDFVAETDTRAATTPRSRPRSGRGRPGSPRRSADRFRSTPGPG